MKITDYSDKQVQEAAKAKAIAKAAVEDDAPLEGKPRPTKVRGVAVD